VRVPAFAALVFLVAAVGTACGGSTDEAATPPTQSAPANSTRTAAAPVAGVSLDGKAIALGDFRGRPVLVNVWSSW